MLVRIEIKSVAAQSFPPGTVGGDWRFSVFDQENQLVSQQNVPIVQAEFDLPAGENYRADGVRLSSVGETLGPVKSVTFNVSDTTPVQIAVADGITATQLN